MNVHIRAVLVDDGRGRLVADFIDGEVVIHFKDCTFTKEAMTYYGRTFSWMLAKLRSMGYKRVWGTPFESKPWSISFARSFGFKENHRAHGIVFMVRDISGEGHG